MFLDLLPCQQRNRCSGMKDALRRWPSRVVGRIDDHIRHGVNGIGTCVAGDPPPVAELLQRITDPILAVPRAI